MLLADVKKINTYNIEFTLQRNFFFEWSKDSISILQCRTEFFDKVGCGLIPKKLFVMQSYYSYDKNDNKIQRLCILSDRTRKYTSIASLTLMRKKKKKH